MSQKKYLFDSDCLIVAKNSYYSPEFSSAFWDWLITGNQQGVFFMVDKVIDELKQGREDDFLYKFSETHGDNFKLATTGHDCLIKYAELQNWASSTWVTGKNSSNTSKALEVFANVKTADPWQVAYASLHGCVIVSNERPEITSQKSVKLPDAANAFGVNVVKLHEVLAMYSGQNFTFKIPMS
jgi:hypothetical protein